MEFHKWKIKEHSMSMIYNPDNINLFNEIITSDIPIDIYGYNGSGKFKKDQRIKTTDFTDEPFDKYASCIVFTEDQRKRCISWYTLPITSEDLDVIQTINYNPYDYEFDMKHERLELFNDTEYKQLVEDEILPSVQYQYYHFARTTHENVSLKLCNIHIPKTGSTSLKALLNLKDAGFTKSKGFITMIVIRNPMTRIVSAFTQVLKKHPQPHMIITQNAEFYKHQNNLDKSFELFLDFITDNFYDPHVIPQSVFLREKHLTLDEIDYVIDFDHLHEQIKPILKRVGISNNTLPHRNKKRFNINIDKHFEKIKSLYKEDFELYEQVKNISLKYIE